MDWPDDLRSLCVGRDHTQPLIQENEMYLFNDSDIDQIHYERQSRERDAMTEEERTKQDAEAIANHLEEEERWRIAELGWRNKRRG